ncbi:hypothetical protein QA596_10680 [Balneolales bacterium ANBcel1]|nr:hypothetical protein [Balneolales bacterium ANBcel1]
MYQTEFGSAEHTATWTDKASNASIPLSEQKLLSQSLHDVRPDKDTLQNPEHPAFFINQNKENAGDTGPAVHHEKHQEDKQPWPVLLFHQ